MIIESQDDVTRAVLEEMHRTPDARTKELLSCLVKHLHAFLRETKLTEKEFQEAIAQIKAIGKHTTPSHNEAMLLAGALGASNLVCFLNNTQPTQANNLGPFWREGVPRLENGASLLRSPTPGTPLAFKGLVVDQNQKPVAGAEVDVWHSSTVGLYENQDPSQAEMNLRGVFVTDAAGSFGFRSVKPAGYPVPTNGPNGVLLAAQKRHNMRPAHLHFLIYKPGFKTIASQVYVQDDPYLETDSQFGVTKALIGDYRKQADGSYALAFTFVIEPGEARRPKAPISAKATATS
jgi:protocatechuate 3,4-dioxygenase beta subunit